MAMTFQSRLDAEVDERLTPIVENYNGGKNVELDDIFSKDIATAIRRSNIFLSGVDAPRIMSSIPFYGTVFVEICSRCAPTRNIEPIRPLLHSGPVVPVLINSYSDYPKSFVKEIIKFPHIARNEFNFYRDIMILSASAGRICPHCAREKLKDLLASRARDNQFLKSLARQFLMTLRPFVSPDFTLIDQFANAVKGRDLNQVMQLMRLAMTLESIRTAQAMGSAQAVPLDGLLEVTNFSNIEPLLQGEAIDDLKKLAADELGLVVPTSISIERYLDVVLPFQKRLSMLVDEIVEGGGKRPYAKIFETVQHINSELRRAEGSKRFLAYRAIAGFAAGNSTLIGGLLVSGALGVGGHLAGCGATLVTAVGSKLIKKWKPVKENRALQQLGRSIRASLQPTVAKVLAGYLGISTRAVEVWQLRREMVDEPVVVGVGSPARADANEKKKRRRVARN